MENKMHVTLSEINLQHVRKIHIYSWLILHASNKLIIRLQYLTLLLQFLNNTYICSCVYWLLKKEEKKQKLCMF